MTLTDWLMTACYEGEAYLEVTPDGAMTFRRLDGWPWVLRADDLERVA